MRVPPSTTTVSSDIAFSLGENSSHWIVLTSSRLISMSPVMGFGMLRNALMSSQAALRSWDARPLVRRLFGHLRAPPSNPHYGGNVNKSEFSLISNMNHE